MSLVVESLIALGSPYVRCLVSNSGIIMYGLGPSVTAVKYTCLVLPALLPVFLVCSFLSLDDVQM